MTDDDLTAAQRAAIEDLRAKVEAAAEAERARLAAITARTRAVQQHEETLRAMGWRRVARVVGGVTESTLRNDARTRIEEEG